MVPEARTPAPWPCSPLQSRVILSFLSGTSELAKLWLSWRRSGPAPQYQFPVAAVTNDHKYSGLNNTNVFSPSLEVRNPKVKLSKGCVPFVGSRRECFLAFPSFSTLPTVLGSFFKDSRKASSNFSDSDLPVSLGTLDRRAGKGRKLGREPGRWVT